MRPGVIVNKDVPWVQPACFSNADRSLNDSKDVDHPLTVAVELSDTQDYRYRGTTLHLNTRETAPIQGWIHTRRWRMSQNSPSALASSCL